jgi:hypothetical protein
MIHWIHAHQLLFIVIGYVTFSPLVYFGAKVGMS